MKRIAVIVLGVVVVAAAAVGVAFLLDARDTRQHIRESALREPAAKQDWEKEFGDPEEMLAAFPPRENDGTALRVIELSRKLGIDVHEHSGGPSDTIRSSPESAVYRAIKEYGTAELLKPGDRIDAPPENVRVWLESNARDLDAIVALLSDGAPPCWMSNLRLGAEAPLPNLLGEVRLQRVFAARALSQMRGGLNTEAERTIRASWTLNQSLSDRPEVISQMIAISVARIQAGLGRRLVVNPELWRRRFTEHDYRASLLRAQEIDTLGVVGVLRGTTEFDRASRADFLDQRRTLLVGLRDSAVSDGVLGIPGSSPKNRPRSAGDILFSMAWSNLANVVRRVDRLIVDTELTDRILTARSARAALGRWPPMTAESESRVRGARWISVTEGDQLTIKLSRDLDWDEPSGLVLPPCFESS